MENLKYLDNEILFSRKSSENKDNNICISFKTSHGTHIHVFLVLNYKLKQIKIIPTTFKMSFFKNRMFFPNKRHNMIKCCVLPDLKQSMAQIQHLMKTIGNSQNPDLIVIKSFGWK